MLLMPLTDHGRALLAPIAIAHGARLVAAGPLPGSLVVQGDSADLIVPLLDQGVVTLASTIQGCGVSRS